MPSLRDHVAIDAPASADPACRGSRPGCRRPGYLRGRIEDIAVVIAIDVAALDKAGVDHVMRVHQRRQVLGRHGECRAVGHGQVWRKRTRAIGFPIVRDQMRAYQVTGSTYFPPLSLRECRPCPIRAAPSSRRRASKAEAATMQFIRRRSRIWPFGWVSAYFLPRMAT